MKNYFSLKNKSILVTGASSGIGRETAIQCSKMGAELIITGRNEKRLLETAEMMDRPPAMSIIGDLLDKEFVDTFPNRIEKLDGIVHSAGIHWLKPFLFLDVEQVREMMNVNFIQPVELTRILLKKGRLNKGSSVVFISSVAVEYSTMGNSSYAASKAALNAMCRIMALELSKRKIRVNTILPGTVKSPMIERSIIGKDDREKDMLNYPLGYGEPVDVANACIYLLSEASKWITGIELAVDGGVSL